MAPVAVCALCGATYYGWALEGEPKPCTECGGQVVLVETE